MNRKFIILSLYFFSTICLFSVGFSSWTIVSQPHKAVGNIVAENVIATDEILILDVSRDSDGKADGIDVFEYYSGGIIDKQNNIIDTAKVTVYYKIDLNKFLESFYPGQNFDSKKNYSTKIYMALSQIYEGTYNIFDETLTYNINIESDCLLGSTLSKKDGTSYTLEFNIVQLLKNYDINNLEKNFVYFTVEYNFTINRLEFIQNTYPALINGLDFSMYTKLESGN